MQAGIGEPSRASLHLERAKEAELGPGESRCLQGWVQVEEGAQGLAHRSPPLPPSAEQADGGTSTHGVVGTGKGMNSRLRKV